MLSQQQQHQITHYLQQQIPSLLAVYLFGSQALGEAMESSDVDLAVYHSEDLDTLTLWYLSSELANLLGKDVDLVDFNQASTVFQSQILLAEQRLWCKDHDLVDSYEASIITMKLHLDASRAEILQSIRETGQVYSLG